MPARDLPNNAIWAFEFIYDRLDAIERHLAPLADQVTTQAEQRRRVAEARIAALKARERIVTVRPEVARQRQRRQESRHG